MKLSSKEIKRAHRLRKSAALLTDNREQVRFVPRIRIKLSKTERPTVARFLNFVDLELPSVATRRPQPGWIISYPCIWASVDDLVAKALNYGISRDRESVRAGEA